MGLSTALELVRQGKSVRVLEANEVGTGASGLNGGQVIPGLKYDPDWLIEYFGPARGEAMIAFAQSTADSVFDLIDREHLSVPRVRNGWIQAAHTENALKAAQRRDGQWRARGADVRTLDAQEIESLTGARGYLGGWLDRRAGIIDPLAFVSQMAAAVVRAGGLVTERTKALSVRREAGGWTVQAEGGRSVRSRFVVVATNAYSDDFVPGLARTIVPLHSFQIATEPLPDRLQKIILPGEQAVSDSRRILVYYRKSADGRLVLGGRGRMAEPKSQADWKHLERAMRRLYPEVAGVPIARRWFGRVAMTPDHLPHIHEPEPGLLTVVGCQGRGVGMMTALGQRFACYIETGDRTVLPFPVTAILPIPFHAFRQVGVAAMIAWYRLLDALEK
ncbi:glycine/D-amino acid oxidase-like deaminating enzyme [Pararhizobium capsulatum DSM 1112]|uniref:Glycine/D-amino acid oxidase-like deaminating enzyme n=1 Tax=Pararhizobium capsulatum DSM 1112 TaxID=1121113 RepID=A0ABU0BLE6_9HYPH|nr:FAD-dependent oxidoreductase [Pararhizobium capsulatum]MDQ0319066.1 glycine/D-amino acid oxidase-like deaminating enzyme [Pararhizobium capsulatum DSM 1112]